MQVKKEEMRNKILECAEDEFLKKGYENSSLRTIAKKANTTLGNIYHYYPNKEAILEEILIPAIEKMELAMVEHIKMEDAVLNVYQMEEYLERMIKDYDMSEFSCFLDRRVLILLNLKSSYLVERKDKILEQLRKHMQWHFKLEEGDTHYSGIIVNMLVECVQHVLIEHKNLEDAEAEFAEFFRFFGTGFIGQIK